MNRIENDIMFQSIIVNIIIKFNLYVPVSNGIISDSCCGNFDNIIVR